MAPPCAGWYAAPPANWRHLPTAPAARYLLEDQAGYPIECPLCGGLDHWQVRYDETEHQPRAFVCAHTVATNDGLARRTASVSIDQVGGYLDLASLVPSAG